MKLFNGIFNGKRVLVTGHTGFKGAWLCLLLHKLGADVYGYALEPPTNPNLFSEAEIGKSVTSHIGDIRDYEQLLQVIGKVQPEIIIHMAAQALVLESYKNPVETYAVNVMGTVNLLEAVRHTPGIKAVVNVTTDKCYENREWVWGYRENEPLGGYDPYSSSKACSEQVTSAYRNSFFHPVNYEKHGVALASARAGNVIGGGDWAADRLIPDVVRALLQKESVKIRNPYAIRPWQHVLEPLTGYLTLAAKLFEEGPRFAQAWNFGPDDSDAKNVEWIVQKICTLWEEGASYEIEPVIQPHEATYLKLDCSKSKTGLNWYPRWNLEYTLHKITEFYRARQQHENLSEVCGRQIEEYFEKK